MNKTLIIAPNYQMGARLAHKLGFEQNEILLTPFTATDKLHGIRPNSIIIYSTDFARLPDEMPAILQPIISDMKHHANQLEPWFYAYQRIFNANYWKRLWWAMRGKL